MSTLAQERGNEDYQTTLPYSEIIKKKNSGHRLENCVLDWPTRLTGRRCKSAGFRKHIKRVREQLWCRPIVQPQFFC